MTQADNHIRDRASRSLRRDRGGCRPLFWGWRVGAFAAALALVAGACEPPTRADPVDPALESLGADQLIMGFQSVLTKEGVRNADLLADTAFLFRDSTAVSLRQVKLTIFNAGGSERATVTSDWGTLDQRTERMVARGNVILIIPDGNRRLESAELHYDPEQDKFWSDSATVLTEEGRVITGTGFDSDLGFNRVSVRNASVRGGGIIRF